MQLHLGWQKINKRSGAPNYRQITLVPNIWPLNINDVVQISKSKIEKKFGKIIRGKFQPKFNSKFKSIDVQSKIIWTISSYKKPCKNEGQNSNIVGQNSNFLLSKLNKTEEVCICKVAVGNKSCYQIKSQSDSLQSVAVIWHYMAKLKRYKKKLLHRWRRFYFSVVFFPFKT